MPETCGIRQDRVSSSAGPLRKVPAARRTIELWRIDHNALRLHTSLNGLAPFVFAHRSAMDHNQNGLWL